MQVKFQRIKEGAVVPVYGTEYSAGADLTACVDQPLMIKPGNTGIVPTGIAVEITIGFFGMLCPRSGLAAKYGLTLLNSPGIIDSDYRGEMRAILINHSDESFYVENGMRIAQLIIVPFQKAKFVESNELMATIRGSNGFGSTGIRG
ncbi:MAG: dUTP diphosphatase [Holosporales bacterium]|jgi:dUTP pyrophosphatase|nr:dUTP diphosphatase [Holosporales bacterium]